MGWGCRVSRETCSNESIIIRYLPVPVYSSRRQDQWRRFSSSGQTVCTSRGAREKRDTDPDELRVGQGLGAILVVESKGKGATSPPDIGPRIRTTSWALDRPTSVLKRFFIHQKARRLTVSIRMHLPRASMYRYRPPYKGYAPFLPSALISRHSSLQSPPFRFIPPPPLHESLLFAPTSLRPLQVPMYLPFHTFCPATS